MAITKNDVMKVAELARLGLTAEEAEVYTGQLQRILGYVEQLSELDASSASPDEKGSGMPMRADAAGNSIGREEALANAPDEARGCFRVPQIIE